MINKIKIAICGPFSGQRSAYGELLKKLCQDKLSLRKDVSFDFFDDVAQPKYAEGIAEQIINENFDLVFGHFNSLCVMTVMDSYRAARIGLIAPLSTHPELCFSRGGASFCPHDLSQINLVARFAYSLGKSWNMITDETAYGNYWRDLANKVDNRPNLILNSADDFGKLCDQDLVFLGGVHANLIPVHNRLRQQKTNMIIVCCDDCFIQEYFKSIKQNITNDDYVIGFGKGHAQLVNIALEYLLYLLDAYSNPALIYKQLGCSDSVYKFTHLGRYQTVAWEMIKQKDAYQGLL